MNKTWRFIRQRWRIVREASPQIRNAFLQLVAITVIAACLVTWYVVDRLYDERTKIQAERLQQKDDLLQEYRQKLKVDSPEAAVEKIQQMEKQLSDLRAQVAPRRLSAEQVSKVTEAAQSACPVGPMITVAANATDHEAMTYGEEVVRLLNEAGCVSKMDEAFFPLGNLVGAHIGVRDFNNIPLGAKKLKRLFSTSGVNIEIDLLLRPEDFPDAPFVLAVGAKP